MPREEREEFSHPAFGMISLNRVQCGGYRRLHGSDVGHHSYIALTVCKSQKYRDLSNDWHHSRDELIRVALSPVQLSELLFNMNTTGIPCTLERYRDSTGKFVSITDDDFPGQTTKETYKREMRERVDTALTNLKEAEGTLKEMLEGKTLRKGDAEKLLGQIQGAHTQISSNLAFVLDQFNEKVEDITMRAKGEVEGFIAHRLQELGAESVKEAPIRLMGYDSDQEAGPR